MSFTEILPFNGLLPTGDDPASFDARAEALMSWLVENFAPQITALAVEIQTALGGSSDALTAIADLSASLGAAAYRGISTDMDFLGVSPSGLVNRGAIASYVGALIKTMGGNQSGAAPVFAARAWVHFSGVGTPTILAGGNVSSITDNGVGDYTVNFTTPMPDGNYAVLGTAAWNQDDIAAAVFSYARNWTKTVSAFRFTPSQNITASGASPSDSPSVSLAFFG